MQEAIDELKANPDRDPIVAKALKQLYKHYTKQYKQVNDEVICNIAKDALVLGASREHQSLIVQAVRQFFNDKKDNKD